MTQYGTWVSYSGSARIWLAAGLLAAAGCAAYAGARLPPPRSFSRPRWPVIIVMFAAWAGSLVAWGIGLAIYVRQYLREFTIAKAAPVNHITPVTLLAALALFLVILIRGRGSFGARLGGAVLGAMAAPMIFELPFDLIVMARTYPPIPPSPALYRALFFVPLFAIELTTLWLLRLSRMVAVRRPAFICFALMLAVYAAWALEGFSYPATAVPIAFNVVSKLLAFVTTLALFFPLRLRRLRPAGAAGEAVPAPPAGAPAPPVLAPHSSLGAASRRQAPAKETAMSNLAIEVRGLRKSFGAKEAVAGIDLQIAAGSLAGLVGPNGAGKTTSLSMMTGLLRPDGGQVTVNGLDLWTDPPAAKAVIGVVPAEVRLFERLSGQELLEYAGRLHGLAAADARARAVQLLGVLDLTGDAKRLVADYSTGMRKKAALGCALIHNPAVLFLDEPLEGVDPVSADVIRRLLARYAASGSTVLFSSHVMELVEQVCDHVSIIDKGKIVATGTTAQVRDGKSLQQAFIDLVGARATDKEVLSWLGSSSS